MADISLVVGVDTSALDELNRKMNESSDIIELSANKAAKDFDKLKKSIDPSYRAIQTFRDQVLVAQKALVTGAIGQREYASSLELIRENARMAGVTINQFGRVASTTVQKTKRLGSVGFQQLGYQIQDFAVQVQSGQSALVAFAQQGSQLISIFGAGGAIAGAVLAIGTGLAGGILAARRAAEGLEESFDNLEEAVNKYADALERAKNAYGSFSVAETIFNQSEVERGLANLLNYVENQLAPSFIDKLKLGLVYSGDKLQEVAQEMALAEFFGMEGEKAGQMFGGNFLESLQKAIESGDAEAIQQYITDLSGLPGTALSDEFILGLQRYVEFLGGAVEEAKDLAIEVQKAYESGEKLSGLNLDGIGLATAAAAAKILADNLGIAYTEALSLINAATYSAPTNILGGRGSVNPDAQDIFSAGQGGIFIEYDKKKSRGGGKKQDPLEKLKEQIKLEKLLLGETEARQRVIQSLGVDYQKYGETAINSIVGEIEALMRLQDEMDRVQDISDSLEDGFSGFFNSLVDGTKTVEDAFKDMARSILAQLWDILVTQQIVGSWNAQSGTGSGIVGGIMGWLRSANGNVFMNGQVVPFANGGIVNGPTLFPMANGMGLMGEAGPEAVMPLKRGKDGKLGVAAEGGKGDTYVINQNFNFSANGDESVRRIIAQAAPEISKITQRDILETRRRGGTFKAAFG